MKEHKIIKSKKFDVTEENSNEVFIELEKLLDNYSKEGYYVSKMTLRGGAHAYEYLILLLERDI